MSTPKEYSTKVCPKCGAPEVHATGPRTVYNCDCTMTPHGETPDTDLQLMRSFRVFDAEGHETDSESLVFADVARKLERQRDALKKQVESAFKLLSAVTDSGCNDVDGKNWYDARTALLSKPSNPTP